MLLARRVMCDEVAVASSVVRYELDDQSVVWVEVDPVPGFRPAGGEEIAGRVREAVAPAVEAARVVLDRVRQVRPDEVKLKFGIKVSGSVISVCAVAVGDRDLVASASEDRTVRVWDPVTGNERGRFEGHTNWVTSVCAVAVGDRELLVSASEDRTVRVWDPTTGRAVVQIPTYSPAHALAVVDCHIVIGLATGLLAIQIAEPLNHHP